MHLRSRTEHTSGASVLRKSPQDTVSPGGCEGRAVTAIVIALGVVLCLLVWAVLRGGLASRVVREHDARGRGEDECVDDFVLHDMVNEEDEFDVG